MMQRLLNDICFIKEMINFSKFNYKIIQYSSWVAIEYMMDASLSDNVSIIDFLSSSFFSSSSYSGTTAFSSSFSF